MRLELADFLQFLHRALKKLDQSVLHFLFWKSIKVSVWREGSVLLLREGKLKVQYKYRKPDPWDGNKIEADCCDTL